MKGSDVMSRIVAIIYVLIGAASYGFTGVITKFAYAEGFTAQEVAAGQVLFGTSLLWLFAWKKRTSLRKSTPKQLFILFLSGAFPTLTTILYYTAIERLTASLAIILLFQFTWMGVIIESIRSRKLPSIFQCTAILLILTGTVLAAGVTETAFFQLDGIGLICGLLAAVGYTAFLFANGNLSLNLPSELRGAWLNSGGLTFILLLYSPAVYTSGALQDGLWKWGLILGITGAFLPTYLFAKGIPVIGSGLASLLGSVELPVAILATTLILKEKMTLLQAIGVLVILLGIVVANRREKKRIE